MVDVFDLGWWPTFNVADVAITVGAGLLALSAWRAGPTTAPST
ncbi:MAG: signal peptidase II [Acidimicrobiales bacterium]